MTKLEELIFSLTTVIVRYHDTQVKVAQKLVIEIEPKALSKKSRENAKDIINSVETKFNDRLQGLINTCTKGYPDRLEFLTFLLQEVIFLKAQLEKQSPYSRTELEKLQQQVSKIFTDLRGLLLTPKDKKYKVTYSSLDNEPKETELAGVINNGYIGNHFCNSGLLLNEEVLGRFHMYPESSDEEIEEIASSLCTEHQNLLLASSFHDKQLELEDTQIKLQTALSEIDEFKNPKETDNSSKELEEAREQLKATLDELEEVKKQLEAQKFLTKTRLGYGLTPFLGLSTFAQKQQSTTGVQNRFFTQTQLTDKSSINADDKKIMSID